MRPNLTLPKGMTFDNWWGQITVDLLAYDIPKSSGVKNWRRCAYILSGFTKLGNIPPPSKLAYPNEKDWEKWGFDFIRNVDFP